MGSKMYPPITGEDLPALQYNSDLLWGRWTTVAGDGKANIRYMISNAVTNPESIALINRAKKNACAAQGMDEPLQTWPGLTFEEGSEEFEVCKSKSRIFGYMDMLAG